jgi:hypothetical protein
MFAPYSPSYTLFPYSSLSHWYEPLPQTGPALPGYSLIFVNEKKKIMLFV